MASTIDPTYPPPDPERAARICQDVIDLLKMDGRKKPIVERWLELTLSKAQRFSRLPWWFTRRLFGCRIFAGQDMFDLTGKMDRIINIYCLEKLSAIPLGTILEYRHHAYHYGRPLKGEPKYYAFDGHRLHLFPAPKEDILLAIQYSVPLAIEELPDEWETILLDGVIGLYGRFFDSTAIINKGIGQEFPPRFWEGLKAARQVHFDSEVIERQIYQWASVAGDTLYTSWMDSSQGSIGPLSVVPAYRSVPGEIQIPADKGLEHLNQQDVPVAQIPGNYQPDREDAPCS